MHFDFSPRGISIVSMYLCTEKRGAWRWAPLYKYKTILVGREEGKGKDRICIPSPQCLRPYLVAWLLPERMEHRKCPLMQSCVQGEFYNILEPEVDFRPLGKRGEKRGYSQMRASIEASSIQRILLASLKVTSAAIVHGMA